MWDLGYLLEFEPNFSHFCVTRKPEDAFDACGSVVDQEGDPPQELVAWGFTCLRVSLL